MLTTEQYAASIVEKYHVVSDTGSASHRAADKVIPLIKQWGKQYLLGITLSGAYAKNTAVSLSSDVDVLIALNPVPNMEMKGIFWGLFEYLTDHDLRAHTRNVSIQLEIKGHKVDLIPACRNRESSGMRSSIRDRAQRFIRTWPNTFTWWPILDASRKSARSKSGGSAAGWTFLRFTLNSLF